MRRDDLEPANLWAREGLEAKRGCRSTARLLARHSRALPANLNGKQVAGQQ